MQITQKAKLMNTATIQTSEATGEVIQQWLNEDKAILIDVRETPEYEQEHIPGSLLVPLSCFEAELFPKFKEKILVLHCAVGKRSAAAAKQLAMSGYEENIVNMKGGIRDWKAAGLPTECAEPEEEKTLPILSPHPGTVLSCDFLKPFSISQSKLADELAISVKRVNEIINGKRNVSIDTALRLSRYFSTTAKFWLNLQLDYDIEVARNQSEKMIHQDIRPRRLKL